MVERFIVGGCCSIASGGVHELHFDMYSDDTKSEETCYEAQGRYATKMEAEARGICVILADIDVRLWRALGDDESV